MAHAHDHGVSADTDRRYLTGALVLIIGFIGAEVVVAFAASSLALFSDAAHMLSDAAAIAIALVAMRIAARPPRGGFTYGLKRAEILSAQINGITLLLVAAFLAYVSVRRLIDPPDVEGGLVFVTALAGIAVNLAATWLLSRANRTSLNIEGAFQHILNDLYGFIATAVSGLAVWLTGFDRADPIATLIVVALMIKAGYRLVRESGRIFMEAAPAGLNPAPVGREMARLPTVVEVHDLHIWEVMSGYAALSAHVLVQAGADCHAARVATERMLAERYGVEHTTLQVDHARPVLHAIGRAVQSSAEHCADPHGPIHRADRTDRETRERSDRDAGGDRPGPS
jgi:cobalt-zinc-cadmium efflux system protein